MEESQGFGWYRAVHPLDLAATKEAWRRVGDAGTLDIEHRLLVAPEGGAARWFHTRARRIDAGGEAGPTWFGVTQDIDETKRLERRERTLEEQIRKLLSLTRFVVERTAMGYMDQDEYAVHLESRLDAISRIHGLMLQSRSGLIEVGGLVEDAIFAYGSEALTRLQASGPRVHLPADAGALFGLAISELAMNAAEHGALRRRQGGISAHWRLEGGPRPALHFDWRETFEATPEINCERWGFGRELIGVALPRETGMTGSLAIGRGEARCRLALPLPLPGGDSTLCGLAVKAGQEQPGTVADARWPLRFEDDLPCR